MRTMSETTRAGELHQPAQPALVRRRRELARRVNGGIRVTLYWNTNDNSTSLEVWQPASEERLEFSVAREHALEAFYHPFAYAGAVT